MDTGTHKMKVLLVEPDKQYQASRQEMISRTLGSQKVSVDIVSTGAEALVLFQNHKPYDFVLLTDNLPDISAQFIISTIRYFDTADQQHTLVLLFNDQNTDHPNLDPYLQIEADAILHPLALDTLQQVLMRQL